jgi:hypothetical protein
METTTAFVLNDAIQSWRDGLSRSPNFREGDLAELEAHVRDSVAAWQSRGLTEEEAFLLATRRLGHPAGLEPEFAKVNRSGVWLNRLLWMAIGIQAWGLISTFSHAAGDAVVLGGLAGLGFKFRPPLPGSWPWNPGTLLPAALLLLTTLVSLAGCVAGCWWSARRMEDRTCRVAVGALRRPIQIGLVSIVLLLVINSFGYWETPLLVRHYSLEEMGVVYMSKSLANVILLPVQTIGLVVLTILLLRRHLRLGRAS